MDIGTRVRQKWTYWGRGSGVPYDKATVIHRIALDMQGSFQGLSLQDIQTGYSDEPISRKTAERLRDAVMKLYSVEHANPGELPKRWRIRNGAQTAITDITSEDLVALETAGAFLRREKLESYAQRLALVEAKLKAQLHLRTVTRLEADVEVLMEAEGIAMRPGPRPNVDPDTLSALRTAILKSRKVRLHYHYRTSRKKGHVTVHPYGILYGTRHYLV